MSVACRDYPSLVTLCWTCLAQGRPHTADPRSAQRWKDGSNPSSSGRMQCRTSGLLWRWSGYPSQSKNRRRLAVSWTTKTRGNVETEWKILSSRRVKTITLIVDNYIIQKSRETQQWLKANPKFRVIYQPVYSPWVNHVERLWQTLHDTITRNHQCHSMWQLLKKVRHFMETASPFPGGKHGLAKV